MWSVGDDPPLAQEMGAQQGGGIDHDSREEEDKARASSKPGDMMCHPSPDTQGPHSSQDAEGSGLQKRILTACVDLEGRGPKESPCKKPINKPCT